MEVAEAPDIRTIYDLWLVRWGEEVCDSEHEINHNPFWFNAYHLLRGAQLVGYDFGSYKFKLVTPPWK